MAAVAQLLHPVPQSSTTRKESLHLARVAEDTEMGLVSTSQVNQGVVKEPWVIVMFIKIKMMVATW